jgi:nucleotide-binding universal stress UspA family protein
MRSIIAAVDESEPAAAAAGAAAALAEDITRRLVLVHVSEDRPVFPYGDRWRRAAECRRATNRATELLDGVATRIGEPDARRRIVFSGPVAGGVPDRLAAVAREEDADLLVTGSRGRGPLASALLGSVSASLSREAPCPVVVVSSITADPPLGRDTRTGPIVCAADGSPESKRAEAVSRKLADRLGVAFIPVFVEGEHLSGAQAVSAVAELAPRVGARLIAVGAPDLRSRSRTPVLLVPPNARLPSLAESERAERPLAA